MYHSEPSEKIVMSSAGRAAHHFLNLAEAVFLSRPPVGSVLQPAVKCGARSVGRGTLGRSAPSLCTLVFGRCLEPAPLPRVHIGGVMHLTSGCWLSTVWRRIAKRSFASSRAAIAEGRPESQKRVTFGVVLQTGSTPRAAKVSVLSTISTSHPFRALTISFWPLRCRSGALVHPVYHASVPYSIEGSMQVITALRREEAGGPFVILARLLIW